MVNVCRKPECNACISDLLECRETYFYFYNTNQWKTIDLMDSQINKELIVDIMIYVNIMNIYVVYNSFSVSIFEFTETQVIM